MLEAYAVVCTRMTPDQHTSFVNLLTQTPSIATLLALSSHLSMVAPLAPKRGWVRGEPGGPSGAPSNLSSSFPDEYDGLPRGSEPSLVNNRDAEGQMPITEVIVQPISAEFVARILAMRVQPGSTNPMQLLPEHLQGQDAASTKEPAMVRTPSQHFADSSRQFSPLFASIRTHKGLRGCLVLTGGVSCCAGCTGGFRISFSPW